MRENRSLYHGLIALLFIFIFFSVFSVGALAKTTVDAGEDETVYVDDEIEFHAKGDGTYSWDFNDNEDDNNDNNYTNDDESQNRVAEHSYDKAGEYIVTLTVRDGAGNITAVYKSKITVEEPLILDPWLMGLIFVIIGIIMLLAEASSPGFFIGIPATILIVIGIVGIAFPGLFFTFWSPIIAAVVAIITTIAIITFYKRLAPPEAPTTTVGESLVGKNGIVMVDTVPDNPTKGKVKVGTEIWSATSDVKIKKGAKVIVLTSEGVHITVEEIGIKQKK